MSESRLLIIEDETHIRMFVSANLRMRGFTVVEADNGTDGIKMLRELSPAGLILDILLPDMTGWDVLHTMSKDEHLSKIPVIVMTASVDMSKNRIEDFSNVVTRLTKPASLDQLLAAVKLLPKR
jgi:DNA-binding response OmpR family regulator